MKTKAEVEQIITAALKEADPAEFGSNEDNDGETRAAALSEFITEKLIASGVVAE